MMNEEITHKIRVYLVDPKIFMELLTDGHSNKITKGIPKGAKFRGYCHDIRRNAIAVYVEHESFEEVHESQEYPWGDPIEAVATN